MTQYIRLTSIMDGTSLLIKIADIQTIIETRTTEKYGKLPTGTKCSEVETVNCSLEVKEPIDYIHSIIDPAGHSAYSSSLIGALLGD